MSGRRESEHAFRSRTRRKTSGCSAVRSGAETEDTVCMQRLRRWLVFALVVVLLLVGGLVSVGLAAVRGPLPQLEGEVTLPGLNGRVTVLREAHGVPQVYAEQPEDLFEAQGFLAAQDRFFEMDVRRHAASGRLSELFGAAQLGTDTFARTMGFRRVAEAELALQSPSTRRYLDAYASGVDAYLRGRTPGQISLEYSLLQLRRGEDPPEPWTAVDSLAVLKLVGWQQGTDAADEAVRARVAATVGTGACRRPEPGLPAARLGPGRGPGQRGRQGVRPGGQRVGRRSGRRPGTARATGRDRCRRRCAAGDRDVGRPLRVGAGPRIQRVGGQRRPHRRRCTDALERPAPGHRDPLGARAGGSALHDGRAPVPVRRDRLLDHRAARGGRRAERLDRVGAVDQRRRRGGPLPRGRRRRHGAGRRPLRAA